MKNQYSVSITRFIGDDAEILLDRYISADEAIDFLINLKPPSPTNGVGDDEDEEEEKVEEEETKPEPVRLPPVSGAKRCGKCGTVGHNARSCTASAVTADKPEPQADGDLDAAVEDKPFFFKEILEMVQRGLSDKQIYDDMSSMITNTQYREALQWSREMTGIKDRAS
jgi:hypothetical protein